MDNHCSKKIRSGVGQLTIVEHALCPLDARISALPNQVHEATFRYSDKHRSRRTGNARVFAPLGLSPKDELFLWGLLAITLSDPHTDGELHATRHYCLRKLGLIDAKARRGGRQYRDFSSAIERLASVRYQCDGFYDPIRTEHRRVGFGFFSYSLPLSDESSRAWRIVWDPVFFEFAKATGGSLRFNLDLYCRLDAATRRCYLYLAKQFYRKTETPRLDVRDFAEQILGVAATVELRDKKAKLQRCIDTLTDCGVIRNGQITRLGKGRFMMFLHRGPEFDRPVPTLTFESPLVEPLISVGFDAAGANRIIRRYDDRLTREWVDITLAARERFGSKFFKTSPPAFLTDNLKKASVGERTAPDWWSEVRKAEMRACAERAKACKATPEGDRLADRAIKTLENVHCEIFSHFVAGGQAEEVARANAEKFKAARRRKQKSKPK